MIRRLALLTVSTLILTACEPPAPREGAADGPSRDVVAAFQHAFDADQSGYYLPTDEVRVDGWTFHHMFMGQATDFQAWERGPRDGVFAPLMIEFEDQNSPVVQTELGESRSGRDRILPTRYQVTDAKVVFEGRSETLGPVRFTGDLDAGRLAESKRNLGAETPVLTGTLTVRGRDYPVRMRWWAGD